ncbi:MAG TPA: PIG-L deacetylase family protein [Chloroflexota bacterium]|nr:PIG-L deacetylase family protein [Chloroflexota bacterium]
MGLLPRVRRLLVVIAHPDDESFGLGSVLAAFIAQGASATVLCFTRGERSTLGPGDDDLAATRQQELLAASRVLAVEETIILSYPDGALSEAPVQELAHHVLEHSDDVDALLVFDEQGVTGHPDHCAATAAALAAAAALDLPVLAWAIPSAVAEQLNAELSTAFVGRDEEELDLVIAVDRRSQLAAVACHRSQSTTNPVLRRRLDLLGDTEHLRVLRRTSALPVS